MDLGRLESDPLFLGLTRPAMILGVTYMWVMLEMMIGLSYFINTSSFLGVIFIAGPMHLIGAVVHMRDAKFLDVIMTWAKTAPKCTNRRYHGGKSSYDLF